METRSHAEGQETPIVTPPSCDTLGSGNPQATLGWGLVYFLCKGGHHAQKPDHLCMQSSSGPTFKHSPLCNPASQMGELKPREVNKTACAPKAATNH